MAGQSVFIDTRTGRLRRSDSDDSEVSLRAIGQSDKLSLGLRFVDGSDALVTSTLLEAGDAGLQVTIKAYPGTTTILAQAEDYSLNGQVATVILNCATQQINDVFPTYGLADEILAWLEVRVMAADDSVRDSWRFRVPLEQVIADDADVVPTSISTARWIYRPDFDAEADIDTVDTTGATAYAVGTTIRLVVSSTPQEWLLVAGTATATPGVIRIPHDYNAGTNAKYWLRIL
jgi:hypothetical protein